MRCRYGVLGAMVLLAAACSGSDPTSDAADEDEPQAHEPTVFPGEEWTDGDPEALGFDPDELELVAAEAEQIGARCLLVIRHGQVAGEWYWDGTEPTTSLPVHSVTKSYTSTLVGIAQDHGALDIDDPASDYIDAWVGTPSADVTIRNILSRDTGLEPTPGTGSDRFNQFLTADDRTADAIGLRQDHAPGTVWSLNEVDIQLLEAILEEATGRPAAAYAQEMLLDPIGARNTTLVNDTAGNAQVFSLGMSTCHDAARLGLLALNHGNWDGNQVVSEEWVQEATARPGQAIFPGYGLLWWLNRPGETDWDQVDPASLPLVDDPAYTALGDAAPDDMYWAMGAYGQVIQVHPATDTVVVQLTQRADLSAAPVQQVTTRVVTDALR